MTMATGFQVMLVRSLEHQGSSATTNSQKGWTGIRFHGGQRQYGSANSEMPKFLLFKSTRFVAIYYISHRKLMQIINKKIWLLKNLHKRFPYSNRIILLLLLFQILSGQICLHGRHSVACTFIYITHTKGRKIVSLGIKVKQNHKDMGTEGNEWWETHRKHLQCKVAMSSALHFT